MTDKRCTVGELIEKLQSFNPNLPVFTMDSEYGEENIEEIFAYKVNSCEANRFVFTGMSEGDEYVVV